MSSQDDPSALTALKYMLLCKVMLNLVRQYSTSACLRLMEYLLGVVYVQPEDVTSLLSIKLAVKYAQLREIECMRAIALAHQNRNLAEFERVLRDYKDGVFAPLLSPYMFSRTFSVTNILAPWH